MRFFNILVAFIVASSFGFPQTTWYVPDDFPMGIQSAINSPLVVDGDTIIVRPGTYMEKIEFKGKAVLLTSELGPGVTIIDGMINSGGNVVFDQDEDNDSILDGFTIINSSGPGIMCVAASPTIENNVISLNMNSGIDCLNSSSPIIHGNWIHQNEADEGAGIFCTLSSSPSIENNIISGNTSYSEGGGIYCWNHTAPTISNNLIVGNEAGNWGGGISCWYSSPTVTNNTIADNTAYTNGGGVCCWSQSFPILTNNIVWNNCAPDEIYVSATCNPIVTYCDVEGGYPGMGNINADPIFVDAVDGDFHLTFPSPCKDTGDNSAVTGLNDFEGDPRIAFGTVDMGADEFHTHLYWTGDATPGGNVALKFVGLPGTTPVQLWLGSGILDPPWPTKYGDWYLQFPLLANMLLGSIPVPSGVLVFPFTLPHDTPSPLSLPFQAGVGIELTNLRDGY